MESPSPSELQGGEQQVHHNRGLPSNILDTGFPQCWEGKTKGKKKVCWFITPTACLTPCMRAFWCSFPSLSGSCRAGCPKRDGFAEKIPKGKKRKRKRKGKRKRKRKEGTENWKESKASRRKIRLWKWDIVGSTQSYVDRGYEFVSDWYKRWWSALGSEDTGNVWGQSPLNFQLLPWSQGTIVYLSCFRKGVCMASAQLSGESWCRWTDCQRHRWEEKYISLLWPCFLLCRWNGGQFHNQAFTLSMWNMEKLVIATPLRRN